MVILRFLASSDIPWALYANRKPKKFQKIFRVIWGVAPRDPKVDSLEDECGFLSSGVFLMVPKEALCKFSDS